jgi:hypothetical protein
MTKPSPILDEYVRTAPDPQNALDIFHGEWSSRLPGELGRCVAGADNLFEDARIGWAAEQLGGLSGKTVLELGPLEGAHTYQVERLGAASITAIEANTRAYLRCLIVKELLNLQRARFECGDFVEYLRSRPPQVDVVIASGVLYHVPNPVEVLGLIAAITDRVFIWTHYYDAEVIAANSALAHKFTGSVAEAYQGFAHTLYRQEYGDTLDQDGFCGGSRPFSHWLSRADLLGALKHFGFNDIRLSFEAPQHFHGPAFALAALRTGHTRTTAVVTYVPEPRRSLRGLWREVVRHYQRGGWRVVVAETRSFVRRSRRHRIE